MSTPVSAYGASETCPVCGQPDNCGDCNHTPPLDGDTHGNKIAKHGCDRCPCGVKYWENDHCIDCGRHVAAALPFVTGDGERFADVDDALDHANEVHRATGRFIGVEKQV